jgi:hypothetical protein
MKMNEENKPDMKNHVSELFRYQRNN